MDEEIQQGSTPLRGEESVQGSPTSTVEEIAQAPPTLPQDELEILIERTAQVGTTNPRIESVRRCLNTLPTRPPRHNRGGTVQDTEGMPGEDITPASPTLPRDDLEIEVDRIGQMVVFNNRIENVRIHDRRPRLRLSGRSRPFRLGGRRITPTRLSRALLAAQGVRIVRGRGGTVRVRGPRALVRIAKSPRECYRDRRTE